jgi:hypothetical protein
MKKINRRDFIAAGAGGLAALGMRPQDDDGLVVHEWGVVTVIGGTSHSSLRTAGCKRSGATEVDPGLPPFVLTWDRFVGNNIDLNGDFVSVRKPILYFYSKKRMTASVRVSVPTGAPAAWWPPGATYSPRPDYHGPNRLGKRGPKLKEIQARDGSLRWEALEIDPGKQGFQDAEGWWETARKTDATPVASGKRAEKFLFYDALVTYDPGVDVDWKKGGKVRLKNSSPDPFRHLFAVRVKEGEVSFAYLPELKAGAAADLSIQKGTPGTMAKTLVESGLYPKEADGLVEIWREEFFSIDGTRVLMVASREAYDRLLPIEITPVPKELRRVLVVQLECLDEERREEVARLIEGLGAEGLDERATAAAKLRAIGLPAEAQIRSAMEKAKDPEIKARLQDLLKR